MKGAVYGMLILTGREVMVWTSSPVQCAVLSSPPFLSLRPRTASRKIRRGLNRRTGRWCGHTGWGIRNNDVVEAFLTDGAQGESEDTDGEGGDADAGDGVFEEVGPAGADQGGGLGVVGFVVGGAFEDPTEGLGGAHCGDW